MAHKYILWGFLSVVCLPACIRAAEDVSANSAAKDPRSILQQALGNVGKCKPAGSTAANNPRSGLQEAIDCARRSKLLEQSPAARRPKVTTLRSQDPEIEAFADRFNGPHNTLPSPSIQVITLDERDFVSSPLYKFLSKDPISDTATLKSMSISQACCDDLIGEGTYFLVSKTVDQGIFYEDEVIKKLDGKNFPSPKALQLAGLPEAPLAFVLMRDAQNTIPITDMQRANLLQRFKAVFDLRFVSDIKSFIEDDEFRRFKIVLKNVLNYVSAKRKAPCSPAKTVPPLQLEKMLHRQAETGLIVGEQTSAETDFLSEPLHSQIINLDHGFADSPAMSLESAASLDKLVTKSIGTPVFITHRQLSETRREHCCSADYTLVTREVFYEKFSAEKVIKELILNYFPNRKDRVRHNVPQIAFVLIRGDGYVKSMDDDQRAKLKKWFDAVFELRYSHEEGSFILDDEFTKFQRFLNYFKDKVKQQEKPQHRLYGECQEETKRTHQPIQEDRSIVLEKLGPYLIIRINAFSVELKLHRANLDEEFNNIVRQVLECQSYDEDNKRRLALSEVQLLINKFAVKLKNCDARLVKQFIELVDDIKKQLVLDK